MINVSIDVSCCCFEEVEYTKHGEKEKLERISENSQWEPVNGFTNKERTSRTKKKHQENKEVCIFQVQK